MKNVIRQLLHEVSFAKSDSWRAICNEKTLPILYLNVKQLEAIILEGVAQVFVEVRVTAYSQVQFFSLSGDEQDLVIEVNQEAKIFRFRNAGPENIWEAYGGEESGYEIWSLLDVSSNSALTTLFTFYKEAFGQTEIINFH